jgi:hypothetical protein
LICDHLANEVLHPDRKREQAGPQIVADRGSMSRVREDFAEMVDNSVPLRRLRQHILEPMERLNHSHRGTPRPEKPTRCGRFELDYLIAQTNRFEACANQDFDACGHSRRESEIVPRRHAIDHDASVIATRYSLYDCPVARHSRSSGERIPARPVVKTAINPTQVAPGHETLESFVDCCPAGDIDEISRGPDRIWCRLTMPTRVATLQADMNVPIGDCR